MAQAQATAASSSSHSSPQESTEPTKKERFHLDAVWFALAFVALAAVLLIPIPGLDWPAKVALGMLAFAVIMWVTEAVSYPVSALLIVGLISLLLGLGPDPESDGIYGTSNALKVAMTGFSSSAVALVAAALILAGAMQATGLHKRIALYVLKIAGAVSYTHLRAHETTE